MSELSNLQKAQLGQLARSAWLAWAGREEFLDTNAELSASAAFTAWRHWQQGKACGRQSLLACTQEDFLPLRAHFLALGGHEEQAGRTLVRAASEPERLARYKLKEALQERGLAEGYAAAICQRQYRKPLAEASAKQLWCLVYTVRNRRKPAPATVGANPF